MHLRNFYSNVSGFTARYSEPIALAISTTIAGVFAVRAQPTVLVGALDRLNEIVPILLAVNVIGVSIALNQYSQAASIRPLIEKCKGNAEKLFSEFYRNKASKLHARHFLSFIIRKADIETLRFSDPGKGEDFYIFRPAWDGVWYQVVWSPFAEQSDAKRLQVVRLHEAVLCAHVLLKVVGDMRSSGCCLLSKSRGSQGTTHFVSELDDLHRSNSLSQVPAVMNVGAAKSLLNLALYSMHYLDEEVREQAREPDWQPEQLAQFTYLYSEAITWLIFLIGKIQGLRLANLVASDHRFSELQLGEATKAKLGVGLLTDQLSANLELKAQAHAEYGVANRFGKLRRAAVRGAVWGILFLFISAIAWPWHGVEDQSNTARVLFFLTYLTGINTLFESMSFVYFLVLGVSADKIQPRISSRPPRG